MRAVKLSERPSLEKGVRDTNISQVGVGPSMGTYLQGKSIQNGKVGEEARTKLVALSINMVDLRLVVASSKS